MDSKRRQEAGRKDHGSSDKLGTEPGNSKGITSKPKNSKLWALTFGRTELKPDPEGIDEKAQLSQSPEKPE